MNEENAAGFAGPSRRANGKPALDRLVRPSRILRAIDDRAAVVLPDVGAPAAGRIVERHDLELFLKQHTEHKEGGYGDGQRERRQSKAIPALRVCPAVEVGRDFPIIVLDTFRGFACCGFPRSQHLIERGSGFPAPTTLDKVRPLDLRPVVRGTRESKLWNEFVARYHYLGYKTLVGAQMRYAVHDRDGWPLAMLGFSTAAWKLAPRDNFIGWTRQKREKNLPFVVDNPRFLILPWINIPNLGSHILALIRRRLPDDWTERYNTTPVLIETFVETPRYTGAVYRASGWTRVGTTQGRGRYDRDRQSDKPKKDVWLRPLRRDWKRTLNR